MDDIRKQVHVIDLCLHEKRRIPIEIDDARHLQWHPHAQIETGDGQQLHNELLVATPFDGVQLHRSSLKEHAEVKNRAEDGDYEKWRVVVEEQIDVRPCTTSEVARPRAQQLTVIVGIATRTEEYRTGVEQGWIQEAEGDGTVVKEASTARAAKNVRVEDE